MPPLFSKVFHRDHDSKAGNRTVSEMLAAWPAATSGVCDLCAVPLEALSHLVPADEFRTAVRRHYDPYARGRVSELTKALAVDPAASYRSWRSMAEQDTSDWGLCAACAEDVAAFLAGQPTPPSVPAQRTRDVEKRQVELETAFGKDLSARLIHDLGLAQALELGETTLAAARERWTHRYDDDFLTPEQSAERSRQASESGTDTLESRGAFLYMWDAQLVAGDAAREAIRRSGLPEDDQDLYLDLGARILLALD